MKGLNYQLKSILKDRFCLMTFLLPIVAAAALHFAGSIDLSTLGELHFAVLEHDLSSRTITWLERYGSVDVYKTEEELTTAINEPSTNVIGVMADGPGIRTLIAGDELDIFRQAAATLPTLYEQREAAGQVNIQVLERPDLLEGYQDLFPSAILLVAMFMGCTFNAMNIISEKEDGVAFINEILPLTSGQYMIQKIAVGFLLGCLSSLTTACVCFRLSLPAAVGMLALIVLSSFVAALIGLFTGTYSDGLMTGVVCIKVILLLFLAVPVIYALIGIRGPLALLCHLVPSQPAFQGILALSAGDTKAALWNTGILMIHCVAWPVLYLLIRHKCPKHS